MHFLLQNLGLIEKPLFATHSPPERPQLLITFSIVLNVKAKKKNSHRMIFIRWRFAYEKTSHLSSLTLFHTSFLFIRKHIRQCGITLTTLHIFFFYYYVWIVERLVLKNTEGQYFYWMKWLYDLSRNFFLCVTRLITFTF